MTPWYVFAAIPLITALIGYVTNWAAIKMMFKPMEFVGIGPIGWQGVLPRKANKFANDVAETMTGEVMSTREFAERLDPPMLQKLFEQVLDERADDMVASVADSIRPGMWDELAEPAREMVIAQVRTEANEIGEEIFAQFEDRSEELLDLRELIVSLLSGENTKTLVNLFETLGGKELRFIVRSGAVFGFIIGLAQAAAFGVLNQWWLMPIVGAIVGLGTNWIAIQMIFRPHEPSRWLLGYQGLFPKRQAEIAADYGRVAARDVLTPRNLIRFVTEGESGVRMARLVLSVISERIDEDVPKLAPFLDVEVTPELLSRVKWVVVQQVGAVLPEIEPQLEDYIGAKLDLENTVQERLGSMPKEDFERILRGLFEEDEWILVAIGGALGGSVGLLQGALVLATST